MAGVMILGEPLLAKDAQGKLISRIGTVFPRFQTILTRRGTHACQRGEFVDWLNRQRTEQGLAPLAREEESAVWNEAVDLILEGDTILIRPDPDAMPLAFEADALLQTLVPKHRIKFLCVLNDKVRTAVKLRGECWRITPMPMSRAELRMRILAAKIGIRGREIYYYNSTTGTRYLTCQEFAQLGSLDDESLRRHLAEIREFSVSLNPRRKPEIALYMADCAFSGVQFVPYDFAAMDARSLRDAHDRLCAQFHEAVPPEYREDNLDDAGWRNRMFSALIAENDEAVSEETLLGLSPEFFMQIRWLPGGRMVHGELMFDEVFEQEPEAGEMPCRELFDENAREFLHNLVREYDDLEYVNIGRVVNSLSRRLNSRGRRDVFIAVLKQRRHPEETVSIIRMQKWGVREHLDEGVPLLKAMYDSEEYTEYILDRRLGCRHLGMNISRRITTRRICERYVADWTPPEGIMIWSPYFERSYLRGVATDKVPRHRFADPAFSRPFARLLGTAAAANIIVGRRDFAGKVLFDDGDEVLQENEDGIPIDIVVSDQTGTFGDFRRELEAVAAAYADPINRRLDFLPNPEEFARIYLAAFLERFQAIQHKYRKRRRAYDRLFKNRPYDEHGSFAYRWAQVLHRLDATDPRELVELIREHLHVPAHS